MKKIKLMMNSVVFGLFFIMSFIIMAEQAAIAAEPVKEQAYIVSIHGSLFTGSTGAADMESKVRIQPEYVTVPQGATVVWVNWARRSKISISFNAGKDCDLATEAATGFRMEPKSDACYITDYLSQGETSSLRFMKPGTYRYEIHIANRIGPLASGQIIVSEP